MRDFILAILILTLGTGLFAQEGMKVGLQGGIPIGDFDEQVSLGVAADIGYMWALGEIVDLGPASGFILGFTDKFDTGSESIDLPNVQFVPAAASLRVWPTNNFSFGADGGYAIGVNEGNDGGLYARPVVGFLFGTFTELNFSYTHVSLDESSWATVTMGLLFTIPSERRL